MKNLSIKTLEHIQESELIKKLSPALFKLPEKVLQFGTGVLLRGLPDYFIDQANKQGIFNGRIIIIKSTLKGASDTFAAQDNLFTQCIRGLADQVKIEENIVNASISRVLNANEEWNEILRCAAIPTLEIVISNTTEVGIALLKEDKITSCPPTSFPGKLLGVLFARYKAFSGDFTKGLIIIPTELIVDNGKKLAEIVLELAKLNHLETGFVDWLEKANYFCNSLVDRIVPGKMPSEEKELLQQKLAYNDELMIMSESYSLWAIETDNSNVKEKLSFYKANEGVVINSDIRKFRELKLRLLNGTHTLTCGLAFLSGFETVKAAMSDPVFHQYVSRLMQNEIAPAIVASDLLLQEANEFAQKVIDRFSNPFIEHKWINISVQFSSKMKTRILPVLKQHYQNSNEVPPLIAVGFAAFILFMQCKYNNQEYIGQLNGKDYIITDDHAKWFAERHDLPVEELINEVLTDKSFWEEDLSVFSGFKEAILLNYKKLKDIGVKKTVEVFLAENV